MDILMLRQRATQIADMATALADELNRTGASQLHRKLAQMVDELNALLTDPTLLLTPELRVPTLSIHPLIRLRIAANFPQNGTFVSDLAAALQLDERLVRRSLAHSATYHVFYEAEPDFFVNTAASRLLATNKSLCDWILIRMEEVLPGTFKTADALLRYPGSEEPGHSNDTEKLTFQALGKMPLRGERFARAMKWRPNGDVQGQFTVVDVGGGLGHQPAHGADVYLLRLILHDWPNKYATMILRALVPALRPGRREVHHLNEREARDYDLYIMSLQNGRERTTEDVRALLNNVYKRFELTKIHRPVGSVLAIVEMTWTG
ncbi:hypothetical protein BJX76DRAFT_345663 [Aspergillus varians]